MTEVCLIEALHSFVSFDPIVEIMTQLLSSTWFFLSLMCCSSFISKYVLHNCFEIDLSSSSLISKYVLHNCLICNFSCHLRWFIYIENLLAIYLSVSEMHKSSMEATRREKKGLKKMLAMDKTKKQIPGRDWWGEKEELAFMTATDLIKAHREFEVSYFCWKYTLTVTFQIFNIRRLARLLDRQLSISASASHCFTPPGGKLSVFVICEFKGG